MLFEIFPFCEENLLLDFYRYEINGKKRILDTIMKYLIKMTNDSNEGDMILPELQPFHLLEDIVCVLDDLRHPIPLMNVWEVH